jgi:hypothetical protein
MPTQGDLLSVIVRDLLLLRVGSPDEERIKTDDADWARYARLFGVSKEDKRLPPYTAYTRNLVFKYHLVHTFPEDQEISKEKLQAFLKTTDAFCAYYGDMCDRFFNGTTQVTIARSDAIRAILDMLAAHDERFVSFFWLLTTCDWYVPRNTKRWDILKQVLRKKYPRDTPKDTEQDE